MAISNFNFWTQSDIEVKRSILTRLTSSSYIARGVSIFYTFSFSKICNAEHSNRTFSCSLKSLLENAVLAIDSNCSPLFYKDTLTGISF